jgi:hypothetical protein
MCAEARHALVAARALGGCIGLVERDQLDEVLGLALTETKALCKASGHRGAQVASALRHEHEVVGGAQPCASSKRAMREPAPLAFLVLEQRGEQRAIIEVLEDVY